ncbi:hypothetical protein TSAR_010925 [Trichomalopsis sarcophagae]|uniref:Brain-enriched guanylate kinase-associated protein n=1 Tax=Trichomalopsis sarcophagae TaxID=543379 RepID=A0A232FDM4_9HYME|nr:hypothetical protein TSAR_010925 [Trichomalopsis sarcophagae]
MADKCKECGCICKQCNKNEQRHNDMHLHVEIENLRQCLVERDNHIVTMETQFLNEAEKFPNGEMASLKEEVLIWQDKYTRLYEAYKRVQKVNQNLEDKLLRIVDKCETEKGAFTKDIATLSHRLADANYTIHRLTQDNEKYRNDVNLAIQLLQCKPSNFVGQKYESLPPEVQAKVRTYVAQKTRISEMSSTEVRSITVPISTFPPTAMVYNVAKPVIDKQDDHSDDESKPPVDMVSAAIMAKVLEDREKERIFARHCNTCTCHRSVLKVDTESQTTFEQDNDRLLSTKDYFSDFNDRNDFRNVRNGNKEFRQLDGGETGSNRNKLNTQLNDLNANRATFHCINEVTEVKYNANGETSKKYNRYISNAKNNLNLKNSSIYKCETNEANLSDKSRLTNEDRIEAQPSLNNMNKLTKETKSIDQEQAKIDMINERLWKNGLINSKAMLNAKESDVQLEVINERVWRNSKTSSIGSSSRSRSSKSKNISEKPARLTVIEVKSSDDVRNESETTKTEPTTSPSFSGDSVLISSSDPSSLSSDLVTNQTTSKTTTTAAVRQEPKLSGPRNCLMRVTPGSKNILLDNAGAYQTVLYTSGCSRPNTALVHLAKSSRSGRSASISSEESSTVAPCNTLHDNNHLQRVAQWVDTLSTDCHPQAVGAQTTDCEDVSSQEPLLGDDSKAAKRPPPQPDSQTTALLQAQESQPQPLSDLMTFEGSSDDEHKLTLDYESYQANITKEMEETYLKLAASLDSTKLQQSDNLADIGMMTIEQYRQEQKRKSFHAKT